MINIVAPPGCYGTYIARCLHHYTSLGNDYVLNFDENGSSHAFRSVDLAARRARNFHYQLLDHYPNINPASTIIVTGDSNHYLDYYDNQFYKQSHGDLTEYMICLVDKDTIQQRLAQGWNYTNSFDDEVPAWIIREYCSFWLADSWNDGYNNQRYLSLPHAYSFCCEELWIGDIWKLMTQLAAAVHKHIHANEQVVRSNHAAFLHSQAYHNIQLRCAQFAHDTIHSIDSQSPCVSIFDEAYVQYILRQQGYEIRCQDLNQFPATSKQLAKIIYETSNHSN